MRKGFENIVHDVESLSFERGGGRAKLVRVQAISRDSLVPGNF